MNKKKISIIVPSLAVGGAENMVAQLAVNLDRNKFDLQLIVLSSELNTPIKQYLDGYNLEIIYLNKKEGINYKIILDLYLLLDRFKPQIVHTHLHAFAYSFLWILMHKVTMLHTVHNTPEYELSKKGKKLISILYKLNKAIPIAISKKIEAEMINYYKLRNIETIYNPVNISRFRNERVYNSGEIITFINIGRLTKQKNQRLLLNSFALTLNKLKSAKLKILGNGELLNELRKISTDLGIQNNVEFLGNIKETEVELAKSDIFVLSSDFEGLPLTILEAMASSLPIISTNVGGISDIVTDNGILVEAKNEIQLANAMYELGRDQTKMRNMGLKSYMNVQIYDIKNIAKEYERIYIKYMSLSGNL